MDDWLRRGVTADKVMWFFDTVVEWSRFKWKPLDSYLHEA